MTFQIMDAFSRVNNESQPNESYDECDGPSYPEVESEGDCP